MTLVLEVAVGEVFGSEVRWRKFRGMEEKFFWSGGATDGPRRLCKKGDGRLESLVEAYLDGRFGVGRLESLDWRAI